MTFDFQHQNKLQLFKPVESLSRSHFFSADISRRKVRAVEAALWVGKGPVVFNATPIRPDHGRELFIARLERELQLERGITARLRGDNEQDLRTHRSRAAEWEEERGALRLRAERAEQSLAA